MNLTEQVTIDTNDKFSLDSLMSVETASSEPVSTLSMSSIATEWTYQSNQTNESESVRLFVDDIIERSKQQIMREDDDEKLEKVPTRLSSARSRISLESARRIRGESWTTGWWNGMGWMRRTGLLKSRNEQPIELMSLTSTPV